MRAALAVLVMLAGASVARADLPPPPPPPPPPAQIGFAALAFAGFLVLAGVWLLRRRVKTAA